MPLRSKFGHVLVRLAAMAVAFAAIAAIIVLAVTSSDGGAPGSSISDGLGSSISDGRAIASHANATDPDSNTVTNYYEIAVPQGSMIIRLYDETPEHRDNFKKLASERFFDGTTFHRIIAGFMIQGGDPNSREGFPGEEGEGGPGYTLPAEIVEELYHKRGAVAAARSSDAVNPDRRSNGSQFYIVQGTTYDDPTLDLIEQQTRMATRNMEFAFSDEARAEYKSIGGAPNLDGQYTVFGEIVEGFDVLDRVAATPTLRGTGQRSSLQNIDRPLEDVPMRIRHYPEYRPPTEDAAWN